MECGVWNVEWKGAVMVDGAVGMCVWCVCVCVCVVCVWWTVVGRNTGSWEIMQI